MNAPEGEGKAAEGSKMLSRAAAAALPEEVTRAVVESYYPRQVAASDSARSRAQGAYAIASGIALALVAAGVFTNLGSVSPSVRWLAVVAVAAWLTVAFIFFRAVGATPPKAKPEGEFTDAADFVRHVLAASRRERDEVDSRVRLGYWPMFGAIALTVATVAVGAAETSPTKSAVIALARSGQAAVHRVCPKIGSTLVGRVETHTIGQSWVTVRIDPARCSGHSEIRLPLKSLQAVVTSP